MKASRLPAQGFSLAGNDGVHASGIRLTTDLSSPSAARFTRNLTKSLTLRKVCHRIAPKALLNWGQWMLGFGENSPMHFEISYLLTGVFGAAIGAVMIWLLLRHKADLSAAIGRASWEVERVQLGEQLKAAHQEVTELRGRLTTADARCEALRDELNSFQIGRAQLEERALRIPRLEAELHAATQQADSVQVDIRNLSDQLSAATTRADNAATRRSELERDVQELAKQRDQLQSEVATRTAEISRLTEELAAERRSAQEKLALLQQAKQELSDQFKALANEILDEKSRKFTDQNQINLNQLLNPLKQQLSEFKAKVEEVYVSEGKDRSALAQQVKQLMELNQTLSEDANNLALAIRGDRKAQGNWGEIILDDVLERAGLIRGQHYERQGSVKSEDGLTHVIPDVVINLPGDRHMVVDSKLTLPDYRAFAEAESEDERSAALKRHLVFIRNHIKGLSEKNYQSQYGLKSLDFVVMFVPLEPAFMLAVTNDRELFQYAWERNILLVSPSTLLFVVRTVAYLWRQEGLSRNAKEISNRGAELYDKLVGFIADLDKVGERLKQAQDSYGLARKKLSEGQGNVIRQAELLKQLGVKPNKALPTELIESALEEGAPVLRSENLPLNEA